MVATSQNDECANAIELFPSQSCDAVTGTFSGSTLSGSVPVCASGASQDVWYWFTATSQMMGVTLFGTAGVSNGFEVYESSCAGNRIICRNANNASGSAESTMFNDFTIGTAYYIRVFNAFTAPTANTFSICLREYPAPANDNCADAIALVPGPTCDQVTFSFSGATLDGPAATGSCSPNPSQDVWFSFVATQAMMRIAISGDSTVSTGFQVYTESCDGTLFACRNVNGQGAGENLLANTFVIGQTYLIRVVNEYVTPLSTATMTICVQEYPAPANDDCADAIALTPSATCSPVNYTFSGSTLDGPAATGTCSPNPSQDTWFSFVATSTAMQFYVQADPTISSGIQVFTGSCNGPLLACRNATGQGQSETLSMTTLAIGETYFVRVVNEFSTPLTISAFSICLTDPTLSLIDQESFKFAIYPNPAGDKVRLSLPEGVSGSAEFFDLTGRKVLSADAGQEISVSAFPNGIYTVKVTSEGRSATTRLIKS